MENQVPVELELESELRVIPTKWVLFKGNKVIDVEKSGTDAKPTFSIKPHATGWEYFKFDKSDPALIKEVVELILEAIKL